MTVPLDDPLAGLWSAHAWRDGPQSPSHDTRTTRKLALQYRVNDLLSKQKPKIRARDTSAPVRPTREAFVEALSHDAAPSAPTQYPRTMRAPNYANPNFDVRRGTTGLRQQSEGVGEGWRYGRGAGGEENVGTPVAGSLLATSGRYRIGERPAHSPGARRIPPRQYGTKDGVSVDRSGPRTADAHLYIEQQSQTSQNRWRKPLLVGVATQPRSRRPSRRQGYLPLDPTHKQAAANIEGQLHNLRYLGDAKARRKRRKEVWIAKLLAQKCELLCLADFLKREHVAKLQADLVELKVVHESLRKEQQEEALQQADEALRSVGNSTRFIKGYHSDGSHFAIWEKAMQLYAQEKVHQPEVTMKGLR
jgi:hypothetical protein